jgi:hypothetical protein
MRCAIGDNNLEAGDGRPEAGFVIRELRFAVWESYNLHA